MTAVVYHPDYRTYYFGPEHPFSPVRQAMLTSLLDALGHPVEALTPPLATPEEVLTVHSHALVAQVQAAGAGAPLPDARRYGLDTGDVPVFDGMDAAARMLVGGTLHAARLVADGQARKVLQLGGGLHHAQHALASGFCIYNDLAVAIRDLTQRGHRVAYLDIDVHHGDGVQWIHYEEDEVLTISLHESGQFLYPGTGSIHELGRHMGKGYALNVPLDPYTTDASYLEAFDRVVPHALAMFQPDVMVIQCGADAHHQDPLAHLMLTTRAFETLFRRIVDLVDTHAQGRAVFTLGGGYNRDATTRIWAMLYLILLGHPLPETLPQDWLAHWQAQQDLRLTPTLHDPPDAVDPAAIMAPDEANRRRCIALMERAAPLWW